MENLDRQTAKSRVNDLQASPEQLASIAQAYPDLWEAIARHPNTDQKLASWLDYQLAGAGETGQNPEPSNEENESADSESTSLPGSAEEPKIRRRVSRRWLIGGVVAASIALVLVVGLVFLLPLFNNGGKVEAALDIAGSPDGPLVVIDMAHVNEVTESPILELGLGNIGYYPLAGPSSGEFMDLFLTSDTVVHGEFDAFYGDFGSVFSNQPHLESIAIRSNGAYIFADQQQWDEAEPSLLKNNNYAVEVARLLDKEKFLAATLSTTDTRFPWTPIGVEGPLFEGDTPLAQGFGLFPASSDHRFTMVFSYNSPETATAAKSSFEAYAHALSVMSEQDARVLVSQSDANLVAYF